MSTAGDTAFDADVIVVGLGAIGSSAAWQAAARGARVIGIEQFAPGHDQGGSHGVTRLFRVACLEHPGLPPIARRARDRWRKLEESSGQSLFVESGGLMIGRPDSRIIAGTLAAAAAHDVPVEHLTPAEVRSRFPGHRTITDDEIGVWDPEAGILRPEAAIVAAADAARVAGAELRTGERVQSIEPTLDGVTVRLTNGTLRAPRVIVAAGPWIAKLVPEVPLAPQRAILTWFRAKEGRSADLGTLPVFIRSVPGTDEWVWGHGADPGGSFGVKVGTEFDGPFAPTDPDATGRQIHAGENDDVEDAVRRTFPDVEPTVTADTTCIMAHTPDLQFLLGPAASSDRVIIAGGCSGHSFKHAAALGEAAAQLALGEQAFADLGFLSPLRFS